MIIVTAISDCHVKPNLKRYKEGVSCSWFGKINYVQSVCQNEHDELWLVGSQSEEIGKAQIILNAKDRLIDVRFKCLQENAFTYHIDINT